MKLIIYVAFVIFSNNVFADGIINSIARGYCEITHPIEWIAPIRNENTCEQQHILQQQNGGTNKENITIIPTSSHITTDTWGGDGVWLQGKVWESEPETHGLNSDSEESLAQAYRLGRWQLEYAFILYNYNSDKWETTIAKWDGFSHITYAVAWWVNFPSKYIRKASFLLDTGRYRLLIDHVIQLPILITEGAAGLFYDATGVLIGTIFHPIDTACSIIGGVILIVQSIIMGFIDLFLSLFLLIKSITYSAFHIV